VLTIKKLFNKGLVMKKLITTLATTIALLGAPLFAEETDVKGGALADLQVEYPSAFMDENGGLFVVLGGVLFAVMGSDNGETTLVSVDSST
tara:strand:- start:7 stop:279 length:273 start_codon:yes stop_codon:yes gene_type:complete